MARRQPLVQEVRSALQELIRSGQYAPGDRLPNEQVIGERYQVSRATVREAYRGLIEAGYLVSRQGAGTFVARLPQQHSLDLNLSYTEMISAAGFVPSIVVIGVVHRAAGDVDAQLLGIERDAEVIQVERLRLADGRPVVYSVDRVAAAIVPEAEKGVGFGSSLFGMLERASRGARNGRARILPVLATDSIASHLHVEPGSPLLHFDETDFDEDGTPVLASLEWHTSDVFDMWINRRATSL